MQEKPRSKLRIAVLALLLGALISVARIALKPRAARKAENPGPKVTVAEVKRSDPFRKIKLTGEARPFLTTPIYGRVSGFLTEMNVDKGDKVKQGQLLAKIESPETDKGYLSALSDWQNKSRIANRQKILHRRKLISQQEKDQAASIAEIAQAALEVQKVLKDYELVRAPFDGTITARYADPGALVQNATSSQSAAQVLLNISTTDRLRVYAYVDQADAPLARPGVPAQITLPGQPDLRIESRVARTAAELDPRTRTLLTEIDLANADARIVPGSFVTVLLELPTPSYLEVPVRAIVVRGDKTYVPVIAQDSTAHFREVRPGENAGETIRILSGLRENERVALDLGRSVADGQKVQVEETKQGGNKQEAGVQGSGSR